MVEKFVVMNCHVQQKVKMGKTVCDEASVVPWEVHSRDMTDVRNERLVIFKEDRLGGRVRVNQNRRSTRSNNTRITLHINAAGQCELL